MRYRAYVAAFILLIAVYIAILFGLPANPEVLERYDLTEGQAKILNAAIAIPSVLIWLIALYGFLNIKAYADRVADTKEGKGFQYLSIGLVILAFSLPLNSITSVILGLIAAGNPDALASATIIRNYFIIALAFATFTSLLLGARALTNTLKRKAFSDIPDGFTALIVVLTAIYTWLIAAKPFNDGMDERIYYLPSWLLVLTVAIPYILAWKWGMRASYYLYQYHKGVKGIVYKSAFKDMARGIGVVIFVAILIQLITTSTAQLHRLNLTPILLIVYGLLAMYTIGFLLVARGSKKLKQLEDV